MRDILIFGKCPADGLNDITLTVEAEWILLKQKNKSYLSLQ